MNRQFLLNKSDGKVMGVAAGLADTTGVDPLSRRQFWELIDSIRARRPQMSVLVATASLASDAYGIFRLRTKAVGHDDIF